MNYPGFLSLIVFTFLSVPMASYAVGNTQKGNSVLNLKIDRDSPIGQFLRGYYLSNPATMHFADSCSISSAGLNADIEKFDHSILAQEGRGHNMYAIEADSYYKLAPISTVWGNAAYHNGKTHDIKMSDVIDYSVVGPFVIGDEVGGNVNHQRYTFGGGWGRLFGKWGIGAQAAYRAEIAHRALDPRVRNIVSDLTVDLGASRSIAHNYMLALNAGIRVYNQDVDVEFYNPTYRPTTSVFTGLGSYSNRFRGSETESSAHKLTGYKASVQLVPVTHGDSFYAIVEASLSDAQLILHGYSDLTFGTTSTTIISGRMSRKFTFNRQFTFFPTVSGNMWKRTATENLFGTSAENYIKIGERKNYHHNRYSASLNLPVAWNQRERNLVYTLSLTGGFLSNEEYLVEPSRKLKTDFFNSGVILDVTKKIGLWAIGARIGYEGANSLSTSAQWAGLDFSTPEGAIALNNYEMSSCNVTAEHARISVSRALKMMAVTLSAQISHYDLKGHNSGNSIIAALSITF